MTQLEYRLRNHPPTEALNMEAAEELKRIRDAAGKENRRAAVALLKDYERLKQENEDLKRRMRSPIKPVIDGLMELGKD